MPTISIYVPSIGINSGFRSAFRSAGRFREVRASGAQMGGFLNPGGWGRCQSAFEGPSRAFKRFLGVLSGH